MLAKLHKLARASTRVNRTSIQVLSCPRALFSNIKFDPDTMDVDEYLKNLDVTLSPEKRANVERIKRKMKGPNSPRCKFCNLMRCDDLQN